jgi:hypothetical protein
MEVALKPLTKKQRAELHGYVRGNTMLFAGQYLARLKGKGFPWRAFDIVEAPESRIFFGINPAGDRLQPSIKRPPFSWEEAKRLGALVLFLLSGCRESSRISAVARLDPPLTTDMLTVTVHDDSRGWTWRGSDFQSSLDLPTPTTRERETGTRGEIEVSFRLQVSGDTVSEGMVKLPLRSDWRWGVQVVSATSDPGEACFGCTGSKAFPLAPEYRGPERDSVWLVWGGNSISGKDGQRGSRAAGQDVTPSAARGP